ncbi:MAG: S1/P1 nuclease [Chryseolinea sp.]
MKHVIVVLIALVLSSTTFAWGPTGHRATGLIAEGYLTKKAKKELLRILQGQSVAIASTWMDDIRSDSTYDYAEDWHWVTIQDGESYDQSVKNPHGDIIQSIETIITELKSKKLNAIKEREHIKILIHLIADIHQPLHVGGGNDRGGNDVKLRWFSSDSNLHRVWDSQMIDDTHLSYTELANAIVRPDAVTIASLQKSSVRDWANESMMYRKQVYDYGNGKLGYVYSYKNVPTVNKRILEGGVRLAGVLNEIYK